MKEPQGASSHREGTGALFELCHKSVILYVPHWDMWDQMGPQVTEMACGQALIVIAWLVLINVNKILLSQHSGGTGGGQIRRTDVNICTWGHFFNLCCHVTSVFWCTSSL